MPHEIQELIDGNVTFRKKFFNGDSSLFDELVLHGQKPKTLIIACSDSRVDPAVIFNCQPGELFVIRNIANLIPPCEDNDTSYHGTSAALEFGTCFLEVEHIIILGHTHCGGIRALLESVTVVVNAKPHSFIAKWMELARPASDRVLKEYSHLPIEDQVTLCEQYALVHSLQNLKSFPWVQERINNKQLTVHAWYFDLKTGAIHIYDQQKNIWPEKLS